MSHIGESIDVKIKDSINMDAFGRLRISEPNLLLDSTMLEDGIPEIWTELTTTGGSIGAHNTNRASVLIGVNGTSGARSVRQTRKYFKYRSGQSHLVLMTFVNRTANPDSINVVLRSNVSGSPSDNRVSQTNWSEDTVSGLSDADNPSGVTLNPTKAQILVMDMQWLGVGRVRIGIEIDGILIPIHSFLNSNSLDSVYMSRARLPIRYEVVESGGITYSRIGYFDNENGIFLEFQWNSAIAVQLEQICAAVLREGANEEPAAANSVESSTSYTATTTLTSLISLRLKNPYLHKELRDFSIDIINEGTNVIIWHLMVIRGADKPAGISTWADTGTAKFPAAAELSLDRVNVSALTNARVIKRGLIASAAAGTSAGVGGSGFADDLISVLSDLDGTSDILILAVKSVASTSVGVFATVGWRER